MKSRDSNGHNNWLEPMAETQDKSYRLLFSFPIMVEGLIRRFVGDQWIGRLDFSTLEKVSERLVSPELIRREQDLLWRLRYRGKKGRKGGWFYVYLHLEFQSDLEPFMALRVVSYKALLYEDLARRGELTPSGRLPPVLSLVIYNGKAPWNEALSVDELIEPLPGYEGVEPPIGFGFSNYRLIEERGYPKSELESDPNLVATLFQLEQSQDVEDVRRGVAKLLEGLPEHGHDGLREAFATWLSKALLPARVSKEKIPELTDLVELRSMLEQSVLEWRQGWLEEGLARGRKEGRKAGEAELLLRQLEKKFGALPRSARSRITRASDAQLLLWGERVLTAESLDQVFAGR